MSTARKQVRLSIEELHELKHLTGALLALLSFWSLGSLDIGSSPVLWLGALAAAAAFFFPRVVARISPATLRWAGPVLLLLIGGDFLLHIPEFIAPLVRMVVLLIVYRMLAPRNRREDLQVILLCLFCVVVSGVLTVSLLFAFQILMFAPLAMALLFVVCLLDRGKDARPHVIDWERFSWPRLLRRVRRVVDLRVVALCGLMFGLVVAVSSLLFILTPRFDLNQAIPYLELSGSARSGFSEDVRLGEVTEIQEDNGVALRIDVPSLEAVSPSPYWRMLVLDKYSHGGFRLSQSLRGKPLRDFDEIRELRSPSLPMGRRSGALWTFYMEGGVSRYLPVPGAFAALRFQKYQDVELLPDLHVYGLDTVGQSVFSYQLEDLQFNRRLAAGPGELEVLETLPIEVESRWTLEYPFTTLELDLSAASLDLLAAINRELIGGADLDVAGYSQRATDYLWQHFAYSLRPDGDRARAEDPIIAWLESGSQGHCELFAGAFILLAREAGYPARMVVGFAGGSWNAVEDYFVVRNRDAHAWVEIYDAAAREWLRIDPTPGSGSSDPAAVAQGSMAFESGWTAWVDSLRIQWYRRVVNFEQKDQIELAMTLKDVFRGYADAFKKKLDGIGVAIKSWAARPLGTEGLRPLAAVFVFVAAVYCIWRARYGLLGLVFRLLRRPKALDPVRRRASRDLKRLRDKGIGGGVVADLKALRFGPEQSAKAAKPVFDRARRALRSARRAS